jgi:hypothetical protein
MTQTLATFSSNHSNSRNILYLFTNSHNILYQPLKLSQHSPHTDKSLIIFFKMAQTLETFSTHQSNSFNILYTPNKLFQHSPHTKQTLATFSTHQTNYFNILHILANIISNCSNCRNILYQPLILS